VTHLEDSLREYYSTQADQLVLPDRVFDGASSFDDATVSYISMGPEPRRRTPMLLAAAASIALLAGAGVAVSRSGDTARGPLVIGNASTVKTTEVPTVAAADMPLLAPAWLPDGYVLTGTSDSVSVGESFAQRLIIYRDASLPLGSPSLTAQIESEQPNGGGTEIIVQGRPARDLSANGTSAIYLTDPKGVGIRLSSRLLSIEAVKAVAETVTLRTDKPSDGVDIAGLPAGFSIVLDQTASSVPTRTVNLEYGKPGNKDEGIVVAIGTEVIQLDEFIAAFAGLKPEETSVRGKTGYLFARVAPLPVSRQLVWMESPGVDVSVVARGHDDATLQRIAESLQPRSPAAFKQMAADHPEMQGFMAGPIDPAAPAVVTPAAPTTTVTCSISANASRTGVAETECSKLTTPPLWPTDLPAGFSLSKIDESVGNNGNSRWQVLQYTGTGLDGFVGDIRVVMESGASAESNASISLPDSDNSGSRTFSASDIFLRGTRAMVAQELTGKNPVIALSWRERPDLLASIEANSTSLEDLTRMAVGLSPITPEMFATVTSEAPS
jgi:hypothetical protein